MSSYLWKAYYENDVLAFQQYLLAAAANARPHTARGGYGGSMIGSPQQIGSSPSVLARTRRPGAYGTSSGAGLALVKSDLNARDNTGQTLLHHIASSSSDTAIGFATALVEHPLIDLYLQDWENGWTALHRAFYFGNITIARIILERDAGDALGWITVYVQQTIGLIKVKDREGHGPLDLYAATIKDRTLRPDAAGRARSGSDGSDDDRPGPETNDGEGRVRIPFVNVSCDQLFNFGSNSNASLGFGDGGDRQFPERIQLRRPEHLIRRFYTEHLELRARKWRAHDPAFRPERTDATELWVEDIPWLPKSKPLTIQDVHMSKLHSAILTTDPESNLYLCGHGKGGRLGTGDEQTRFKFICIENGALSGKRVATVALGLNHTIALSDDGEIFSWGNNAFGQLGYSLPKTASSDEEPMSTVPRQIYGPLKRELVLGVAASRIHSVAHTASSLFTFGKNEGQLGIIDSDARSLETQTTPRKVAASLFASMITTVAAIDKATVCLLESYDVWVFANYGYAKVSFPLEGFTNYFLKQSFLVTNYDHESNRIVKLTCGGDTICALSSRGEIYTFSISQRQDNQASASTTNPAKIRNAINQPQRIWSPKKASMAARDVGVEADGSIILSTEEGSVWKRTKRATLKDATASATIEYKPKDYKFSRIPGLTRVLAVRTSAYGAYAAIRRDCDVTKTQIVVEDPSLTRDVFKLLSLGYPTAKHHVDDDMDDETRHRFWQGRRTPDPVQVLKRAVLESKDIEADLADLADTCAADASSNYDALIGTTTSDVKIPLHRFMLTGRSRVMRRGFRDLCETSTFTIPDLLKSEINKDGLTIITFQSTDVLTIINLVIYLYTDNFVDFWNFTRNAPKMAHRYRQVRTELMKVATKLEMAKLESAARQMARAAPCLDMDFEVAYADPAFFYDGDVVVQLEDEDIRVHSALMRVRCPFFEGLFMGHAGGRWLAGREEEEEVTVDLKHVNSNTFDLVLRHIYTDTGAELFDDIVSVSLDDFLDAVMDVLSVANELMLDRLSQICQEVLGRFVSVRNVCGLLNAISPSSVHEFKDAALEYLCLSMEAMLQGHHLNELDGDLLEELDNVVRENQLASMPFAKSGRAELVLHERHPELAAAVERNRQARIDAVSLRAKHIGLETFTPGSVGDEVSLPSMQSRSRRKSSTMLIPASPKLKAKASSKDMIFAMDDESELAMRSPEQSPSIRPMSKPHGSDIVASSPLEEVWFDSRGRALPSPKLGPQTPTPGPSTPRSPLMTGKTPPSAGQPWNLTPLNGPKTDMRDIMAQTASSRTSTLSQSLANSRAAIPEGPMAFNLPAPKMSQKDRKRIQHSQQPASVEAQDEPRPQPSTAKSSPAWQSVGTQRPTTLKEILGGASPSEASKPPAPKTASTPHLTMRQTVANANAKPNTQPQKPSIGPSGQGAIQQRSVSDSNQDAPDSPGTSRSAQVTQHSNSKPIPRSIRHQPPVEPVLGLSMSEIVAQQQFEKDVVKEAVAPRDLQDIQAEQEFEEWWSRESARVQEAEKKNADGASKGPRKHRHRGGKSGRGSKGKGKGESSNTPV
jgi:alpha-tubulin suppressor-like RCC1 family protein